LQLVAPVGGNDKFDPVAMLQREVTHLILLPKRHFNLRAVFCPVFDAAVKCVYICGVLLCLVNWFEDLALEVVNADILKDDGTLSQLGDGTSNFFAISSLNFFK
jgi:hypothetical protein